MRKILMAVLLGCLSFSVLAADFTWREATDSYPSGRAGLSWKGLASSSDGLKVAAAAYSGYLYTSTDGGTTWTKRTSAGLRGWYSITSSADGSRLAAVANGGYIYTSSDSGVSWTECTGAGSKSWFAITSSADGSKLAAAVYGGGYVYTSTDAGATWVQRTGAGTGNWYALASSADGTKLAVVPSYGYIYTSTDSGASWTQEVSAGMRSWYAVASSSDGNKLVAGVSGGYLYTSTDSGASWIQRNAAGSGSWYSITSSGDGSKLVAAAFSGNIYTSTDSGATWTAKANAGSRGWYALASSNDGSRLIAGVYGGSLYISTDSGDTWSENASLAGRYWQSITSSSDGSRLAAVAINGYIYTSTDSGMTWLERTGAGSRNWRAITSSADGAKLAVVPSYGYIYISTDAGSSWIEETSAGNKSWFGIGSSSDGSKLIAGASGEYLYTSTDGGASWTQRTNAGSRSWIALASSSDGTKLAAVVNYGYVYTSTDSGATWTERTGMGTNYWNSISYSGDGSKLALGSKNQWGGTNYFYISTDSGETWVSKVPSANKCWTAIAFSADGGKIAAAGPSAYNPYVGYLYTSTDSGSTWTEEQSSGLRNWYGLASSSDGSKIAACAYGDSIVLGTSGSQPVQGEGNDYVFTRNGSSIDYARQNALVQTIANIQFDETALGLSGLTAGSLQPMVTMRKAGEGKLYLNVVGSLADAVNTRNGTVWVTANFATDRIRPVVMNGVQISDSKGHVFPGYASYIDNISFSAGVLTFRIKHFTEYGVPALEAKTFAGSGAGLNIIAQGTNIIAEVPGNSFAGTSLQNTTTTVAKISGLAYETVLSDIPSTINNLYKPLTPGSEYGISFEYINRGNATDTANISLVLTTANVGHYGYSITTDTQAVAPWQVLLFDVKVNANNANAFERATLDATVALPEVSAVSYNAFANAYLGGSFGEDGAYGGVENLSHTFILEAEGYNVAVLSRTATINVPAGYTGSSEDMVPGSKVIYSIAIKNNSTAIATSVNVADQIANNCHLYYTDTPAVEGATAWEWKGVTNNNATSADTNAVKFEITIPANGVVTASYTVTLD